MNRAQILESIGHIAIVQRTPEVIDAFVAEMRTKFYGPQETRQAFFFFCDGWDAKACEQARRNCI